MNTPIIHLSKENERSRMRVQRRGGRKRRLPIVEKGRGDPEDLRAFQEKVESRKKKNRALLLDLGDGGREGRRDFDSFEAIALNEAKKVSMDHRGKKEKKGGGTNSFLEPKRAGKRKEVKEESLSHTVVADVGKKEKERGEGEGDLISRRWKEKKKLESYLSLSAREKKGEASPTPTPRRKIKKSRSEEGGGGEVFLS